MRPLDARADFVYFARDCIGPLAMTRRLPAQLQGSVAIFGDVTRLVDLHADTDQPVPRRVERLQPPAIRFGDERSDALDQVFLSDGVQVRLRGRGVVIQRDLHGGQA